MGTTNEAGDEVLGEDTLCEDACSLALGILCNDFEDAYVKSSNSEAGDRFGYSVSADGDIMVVGAPGEDGGRGGVNPLQSSNDAEDSGAAYVFERLQGSWSQRAYLKAPEPESGDNFGASVVVEGDTIAIGAPRNDDGRSGVNPSGQRSTKPNSGAVYVFHKRGSWQQDAWIKASDAETSAGFGTSVDMDGNTLVVGAPGKDGGKIYLFRGNFGSWVELDRGLSQRLSCGR